MLDLQSRGERGFETTQQLEERVRDLQFKNQKLSHENENLKYTLSVREKDFNDLKGDVGIISKENQSLNNQLVRLTQERELQIQQMGFLQQQEIRLKEQIKMLEMEMSELQLNYSEVCAEN